MPLPESPDEPVESPCIKKCVVDLAGVCVGCHRSLDEIGAWASAPESVRRSIVKRCQQRADLANGGRSATDS